MRIALSAGPLLLLCLAVVAQAGSIRLDRSLPVTGTDYLLQYDDGSACWLTWVGTYRGTWFDVNDFYPGSHEYFMGCSELWFYHHSSYPWDTASFYCEVWNGGRTMPAGQVDMSLVTALHYAPCYAWYSPSLTVQATFWIVINTEMSTGGWPSLLGDNTPNPEWGDHSFFSDDFFLWQPWILPGAERDVCMIPRDFFIRAGSFVEDRGLEPASWAGVKLIFR